MVPESLSVCSFGVDFSSLCSGSTEPYESRSVCGLIRTFHGITHAKGEQGRRLNWPSPDISEKDYYSPTQKSTQKSYFYGMLYIIFIILQFSIIFFFGTTFWSFSGPFRTAFGILFDNFCSTSGSFFDEPLVNLLSNFALFYPSTHSYFYWPVLHNLFHF